MGVGGGAREDGGSEKEAAMAIKGLPKDVGVSEGIKLAMKALS